jgi:hypothetical protein
VRGRCRRRCGKDCVPNPFDIFQDFIVPKTEDMVAALCEPPIACGIAAVCSVLAAIDLNDESYLPTNKIDDIRPNGFLTHELKSTKRSRTEVLPKLLFRLRRISPQSPSQPRLRYLCAAHASRPPHPNPLPACGEREERASWPSHSVATSRIADMMNIPLAFTHCAPTASLRRGAFSRSLPRDRSSAALACAQP